MSWHHTLDERHALAGTLRLAGPDAPTLCGEWRTAQLAAHLVLRERTILEAAGRLPVGPIRRHAEHLVQQESARPYAELVREVERGPSWRDVRGPVPVAWLWSIPAVREQANLLEYLIHHEDVRRAGGDWRPRELAPEVTASVWRRLGLISHVTLRSVPVGLELAAPGHGVIRTRRARRAPAAVTVTGDPVELTLVAFGRLPQARVEWSGAPTDVAAVRGADISL